MAKVSGKRNTKRMRNLRSAGREVEKFAGKTYVKAASGFGRWVITDHSGMKESLDRMPSMGFIDTIKYILIRSLMAGLVSGLTVIGIFLFIAFIFWI